MAFYWVRNKKGQVAAEVGERGLSVHDQGLAWKLAKLKEAGEPPFLASAAQDGQSWELDALLRFLQENDYTLEPHD
jgi:hypothetical protein